MYRFHLTGMAAALCLATSAFAGEIPQAAPQWDGYVAAGGGYASIENDYRNDDGFVGVHLPNETEGFTAEARSSAAYRFTNGLGIQGDISVNFQDMTVDFFEENDIDVSSTDIAAHAFYRDMTFLVGAFGQFGVTEYDAILPNWKLERAYGGGEAQGFWGAFTLYGQAGFQSQDWGRWARGSGNDIDGFFVSAEGRYFATDNLKLSLKAGYDSLDVGRFDVDTAHVGAGVEYRLGETPVSTFLNLDFSQIDSNFLADVETNEVRVLAGAKLNLGTDTLLQRDRSGASLDPVKPLTLGPLVP